MTIERPPFPAAPIPHPDSSTDRHAHLRAWEVLPWVVNGRATPDQAAWVAEHVAGCDDCRSELAWQQRLHDAIAGTPVAAPTDVGADNDAPAAEAGLERGDVIHRVGRTPITNRQDLLNAISSLRGAKEIVVQIERDGQLAFISVSM